MKSINEINEKQSLKDAFEKKGKDLFRTGKKLKPVLKEYIDDLGVYLDFDSELNFFNEAEHRLIKEQHEELKKVLFKIEKGAI